MPRKSKKVTMKDVARFANVAIGTVDRVLNNTGYASPEKVLAVNRAVAELGYVPNRAASALSRHRTVNIGVVYPNKEVYFWAKLNRGIQSAEKQFGPYGLTVVRDYFTSYNPDEQVAFMERFVERNNLQGLAFVPLHATAFNPFIDRVIDSGIPVVTFDNDAPASRRICFVGEDGIRGGRLAGRLVSLFLGGRGTVAVLRGQPNFLMIQQRILGFTEKLAKEFPEVEIVRFYDMYEERDDTSYMRRVNDILDDLESMPEPVGAIFVSNALVNFVGVSLRLRDRLRSVKLVGFDFTDETETLILDGTISAVVAADLEEEGFTAIQILYEYIYDDKKPESQLYITDFDIKIRETLE